MKKLTRIMIIVSMMILCPAAIFAADAINVFGEAYEETEILTGDLFEGVSEALSGNIMALDKLLGTIDTLLANSKTLEESAIKMDKQDAADEAKQMASYLTRIKQVLETGKDQSGLVMLLARYYLHYNNCVMMNTMYLKEMQHGHVEELKAALEKNDLPELEHLAEHLHVHSDQMYYAAFIVGMKVWQKFSTQAKTIADEIFEAARNGDTAAVRAGVEQIQKPVNSLRKLVKK